MTTPLCFEHTPEQRAIHDRYLTEQARQAIEKAIRAAEAVTFYTALARLCLDHISAGGTHADTEGKR